MYNQDLYPKDLRYNADLSLTNNNYNNYNNYRTN